ncbi:hypothetical protein Pcinc_010142 [Petrolisthes cinctipes]|uniref:Uncharacterized protein n=1 Tax=Petrolisthes cinctipes TaxID=88211 RepID=A0AAE1G5C1_PETCI|nr:hypothetical protein Pcinc_010142 [Petrolisthes cinctipes]
MFDQARSLESAQKDSESYGAGPCVRRRIPLPEAETEAEAEGGEEEDPDDPEPLEAAGARQGRAPGQQARNNVVDNVFS